MYWIRALCTAGSRRAVSERASYWCEQKAKQQFSIAAGTQIRIRKLGLQISISESTRVDVRKIDPITFGIEDSNLEHVALISLDVH